MGYILPIENQQYQDYQRRVIHKKQNKMYIEKPYKVIFKPINPQFETPLIQQRKRVLRKKAPTKRRTNKENRIYTEVTGKGKYISQTI